MVEVGEREREWKRGSSSCCQKATADMVLRRPFVTEIRVNGFEPRQSYLNGTVLIKIKWLKIYISVQERPPNTTRRSGSELGKKQVWVHKNEKNKAYHSYRQDHSLGLECQFLKDDSKKNMYNITEDQQNQISKGEVETPSACTLRLIQKKDRESRCCVQVYMVVPFVLKPVFTPPLLF